MNQVRKFKVNYIHLSLVYYEIIGMVHQYHIWLYPRGHFIIFFHLKDSHYCTVDQNYGNKLSYLYHRWLALMNNSMLYLYATWVMWGFWSILVTVYSSCVFIYFIGLLARLIHCCRPNVLYPHLLPLCLWERLVIHSLIVRWHIVDLHGDLVAGSSIWASVHGWLGDWSKRVTHHCILIGDIRVATVLVPNLGRQEIRSRQVTYELKRETKSP